MTGRFERRPGPSVLRVVGEDDVSLYQLQKAIYEYLNPKGRADSPAIDPAALGDRYELTDVELRALLAADVPGLHRLGVHPVLLNSYARARVPREQYRAALDALLAERRSDVAAAPGVRTTSDPPTAGG